MKEIVELTHAEYESGDHVGHMLCYFTLLPVFLAVSQVTIFLVTQEVRSLLFGIGMVLNELLNMALKQAINEARPETASKSGSGNPSNHAQFMAFYATMFVLTLHSFPYCNTVRFRPLLAAGCFCASLLTSYSRVYLGEHFWHQVVSGYAVGVGAALCWFFLCDASRWAKSCRRAVVQWDTSKYLYLKDSSSQQTRPKDQ